MDIPDPLHHTMFTENNGGIFTATASSDSHYLHYNYKISWLELILPFQKKSQIQSILSVLTPEGQFFFVRQ